MKFKSHLYFEEKDRFKENLEKLKTLPGSKITFFKNGQNLGTAFEDIYGVSLHCFKGNRLFVHLKNTYHVRISRVIIFLPLLLTKMQKFE